MAKRVSVDRWLFAVTMLLVFLGLVMVFSASAVMARERFGSPYAFLFKQLIWAVAGLVAMVVTMRVDYRRYKHPALVFSFMGVTTLLLISVFFLDRSHNTHRWIHAGGFSFQPSEFAKLAFILAQAHFLSRPVDELRLPANFWKGIGLLLLPFALIFKEPDLGSALVLLPTGLAMMLVAGTPGKYC